jgi:peroxiredoxin
MSKLVAFTAAVVVAALVAFALAGVARAAEPGPQVGQRFPHSLEAFDQTGRQHNLETLMGDKGLAVLFVRSADWCPFCKRQLAEVNQRLAEFQALGINVATVSVDKIPLLAEFAKSQQIGYRMLADPDGAINLSLGIRDEQYPVGTAQFGVPRPVLYVLDRSGTVRLRYMEPTFRTRPDLNVVLRDAAALAL